MAIFDMTINGQTSGVVWPGGWDANRVLETCRAAMRGEPRHDIVQMLELREGGRLIVSPAREK